MRLKLGIAGAPRLIGICRLALALSAAPGVNGCFSSTALLLSPERAEQPLGSGSYNFHGHLLSLQQGQHGWYRVRDLNDASNQPLRVMLNALPAERRSYVFAITNGDGYDYGVARVDGGALAFSIPYCGDPIARRAALNAGASDSGPQLIRTCTFTSRTQLMSALARWADHQPITASDLRLPLKATPEAH